MLDDVAIVWPGLKRPGKTSGNLLTPGFSLVKDATKLHARNKRQRKYLNDGKRPFSPVKSGKTARLPFGTWRRAECLREIASRSYDVLIDGEGRR